MRAAPIGKFGRPPAPIRMPAGKPASPLHAGLNARPQTQALSLRESRGGSVNAQNGNLARQGPSRFVKAGQSGKNGCKSLTDNVLLAKFEKMRQGSSRSVKVVSRPPKPNLQVSRTSRQLICHDFSQARKPRACSRYDLDIKSILIVPLTRIIPELPPGIPHPAWRHSNPAAKTGTECWYKSPGH